VAALTRKDLKTDRFAQEVGHTVEYVGEHRRQIVRYGAIALVLVIVISAVYYYRNRQDTKRQQELANAIRIHEAPVGTGAPLSFPTEAAKREAAMKAFTEISTQHSGTDEGNIALYYRASMLADEGKLQDAERMFKQVADDAQKEETSLANLALANLYFSTNRSQEAERILRDLIANPTVFVSKEQATFSLARGLARTNPAEAKKLLEPLRTSRSAVSQAAIQLYADLTSTP
jgi:predicted negative regulator of RcsB-dependent stress response